MLIIFDIWVNKNMIDRYIKGRQIGRERNTYIDIYIKDRNIYIQYSKYRQIGI